MLRQILSDNFGMKKFWQRWSHNCWHKALSVKQFLAQKSITEMECLPYARDFLQMTSGSLQI
jgi:hypothetical protein